MKLINIKKTLLALGLIGSIGAATAQAEDYAIIVNYDNNFSGSEAKISNEIRLLFLKEKFRWGNGILSIPIGTPSSSEAFVAFREEVLNMSEAQLKSHWVRIKQLNGDPAPREVSSEHLISRLVARDAGSFGIISKEKAEKLKDDGKVKVLLTF